MSNDDEACPCPFCGGTAEAESRGFVGRFRVKVLSSIPNEDHLALIVESTVTPKRILLLDLPLSANADLKTKDVLDITIERDARRATMPTPLPRNLPLGTTIFNGKETAHSAPVLVATKSNGPCYLARWDDEADGDGPGNTYVLADDIDWESVFALYPRSVP